MKNLLCKNFFIDVLIIASCVTLVAPSAHAQENAIVSLRQTGRAFAQIAKDVSPAVVNIQTEMSQNLDDDVDAKESGPSEDDIPAPFLDLFRNMDPRMQPRRKSVAQGSGFIISPDGYIVTNNHLVEHASRITVKLLNNKEYMAKIVGTDPQSDIAVIKINAQQLPIAHMGDSDQAEVGEWVVALGNPLGLSHSLSAGILSAKGRSGVGILDYESFLQTDAAINIGNSGGPLLDLDGKVIGINTAIVSLSGGYMGIGFAIPINMAKNIIEQLKTGGNVVRGFLGVRIQELTKDLATSFGVNDSKGTVVAQIEPGSPADKAGLKQGDVITALDGKPVENSGDFRNNIAASKPGSIHKISIIREGKAMQLSAKVGNLNADISSKDGKDDQQTISKIGMSVQSLTADIAAKIGYKGDAGVVVSKVKPGSIAEIAGLSRGSVILEVNRKKVINVNDVVTEVEKGIKAKSVLLLMQDQYGSRYVVINMG